MISLFPLLSYYFCKFTCSNYYNLRNSASYPRDIYCLGYNSFLKPNRFVLEPSLQTVIVFGANKRSLESTPVSLLVGSLTLS